MSMQMIGSGRDLFVCHTIPYNPQSLRAASKTSAIQYDCLKRATLLLLHCCQIFFRGFDKFWLLVAIHATFSWL